jgi:APA family basic amino acid/polyamine antiporter
MAQLPGETWLRFVVWLVLGLIVYSAYSVRSSRVGAARRPPATEA